MCLVFLRAGIPILLYHRVGPHDGSRMDRYTVSPSRFAAQMAQLAVAGWQGISLDEFVGGIVPSRRIAVITFDDGFASNCEHAWPVLERCGFRATTFVVTSLLGRENVWDDADIPRYRLLDSIDLRAGRSACMTFQSHGATHANLVEASGTSYTQEIGASRAALSEMLGRPVEFFAYPFGAWNRQVREAVVEAGYRAACTCEGGRNAPGDDPFLLRRVEILEEDIGWRLSAKLRTGWHLEHLTRPRNWRGAVASALRSL